MFRFFTVKKWYLWSWIGSFVILSSLWVQVKIDVKINEWFGEFYDMIQKALGAPNAITIEEYWASLFSFIILAAMYVGVAVVVSYFTSHYLFRWRTAMVEYYHSVYEKARKIEAIEPKLDNVTSLRRQIIPAGQPLPPQPSANEVSPEALARVSEIEKKAKKLSLLELTEKTCKWPVGDPATEEFWFCGLATQSGKPYCEAHVGVAFQPMNSRRDRDRRRS